MNWRTLLATLHVCDPPPPPDIASRLAASATRDGTVDRRAFLQICGATIAAGMALDPERLLWTPGAQTILIPDKTLVTATTMAEAIEKGLIARYADGTEHQIRIGKVDPFGRSIDEQLAARVAEIERGGGRIVARTTWAGADRIFSETPDAVEADLAIAGSSDPRVLTITYDESGHKLHRQEVYDLSPTARWIRTDQRSLVMTKRGKTLSDGRAFFEKASLR